MSEFSFSSRKYIHDFKNELDSIIVEVQPPNNMAVLSDDRLTREPYRDWLRRNAIEQLYNNPTSILDFFGESSTPAPDIFAWYCIIYYSFKFLWSSSSCFSDNQPTQWGKALQTFLYILVMEYGVDEKYITKQSAESFYLALVTPSLFSTISKIDKHPISTYSNRKSVDQKETVAGCGCLVIIVVIIFFIVFFFDKSY